VLVEVDEHEEMRNRMSDPIVEVVTLLLAVPPTEQVPGVVRLRLPKERLASLYLNPDEEAAIEKPLVANLNEIVRP
jgi:hypothetical protein